MTDPKVLLAAIRARLDVLHDRYSFGSDGESYLICELVSGYRAILPALESRLLADGVPPVPDVMCHDFSRNALHDFAVELRDLIAQQLSVEARGE